MLHHSGGLEEAGYPGPGSVDILHGPEGQGFPGKQVNFSSYIPSWYILTGMHVIAKPILVEFWTKHPDAEHPLEAWYRTMRTEVFADFNDLRGTFASADYVDGLTVFNIGGNKYRLIASIHYNRHKVYVRAALTHKEYERGEWKRERRN